MSKPVITVLMAEDEPPMPGLEALEGQAVVREARHREELEAALPETEILLVTDFRTDMLQEVWPDPCNIRWISQSPMPEVSLTAVLPNMCSAPCCCLPKTRSPTCL